MYTPQKVFGALTGTGAIITVVTGFTPSYIVVINGTQVTRLEYVNGLVTKTADTPTFAMNTNLSVTATANGFTIAAAEQAESDSLTYFAIG